MKIAFIMNRMRGGGAERVVSELANEFSRRGHAVTIITMKESGCVYPLEDAVKVMDLSSEDRGILSRIKILRKTVKANDFDVMISFLTVTNIESILSALGLKKKLIISERNNPYVDPKETVYKFLRKCTYPYANGFVFQTPQARDFFSKKIRKKSTVIMNPINPSLPARFEGNREKRIVNVGRLFAQKNHKLFIDAFCQFYKNNGEFIAEIYGDGPLKNELESYIEEKGMTGKILLKGFSENIFSEIKNASMFVMSSDYEGMSNALMEAVGMGIPTISTDHPIGGARMTIEDGVNGFLVPVGDAAAMAEKMSVLANDEEKAAAFSEAGERLKATLSVQKIADEWLKYIETL